MTKKKPKPKPKQQTLADVKYTNANAKRRRRYTVRSFGFSCSSGFLLDKMTGKSLDMRFALVPKLPFLPHQPASREEVWDYLNGSMSEMAIFQHLNFAETFAVAPLGVRFQFADASGIRSNLPQLSYVSKVTS